jgi:hypothetical protein
MEENRKQTDLNRDRTSEESSLSETTRGNVSHEKGSADRGSSTMDEKSSGMGRRDKRTGLSTKDGLAGSDYDGQITE